MDNNQKMLFKLGRTLDFALYEVKHKMLKDDKKCFRYDGKKFVAYLDTFRRQDETTNRFVVRIRDKFDPGCYRHWERGRQPDVPTLLEIWRNLSKQHCRFSKLMFLAHGIHCLEPGEEYLLDYIESLRKLKKEGL